MRWASIALVLMLIGTCPNAEQVTNDPITAKKASGNQIPGVAQEVQSTSTSVLPAVLGNASGSTSIRGVKTYFYLPPECENDTLYYLPQPIQRIRAKTGKLYDAREEAGNYIAKFEIGLPDAYESSLRNYFEKNSGTFKRRGCARHATVRNYAPLQAGVKFLSISPNFVWMSGPTDSPVMPPSIELANNE